MSTRDAYRALSAWKMLRAAWAGPAALGRFLLRRHAHRTLARHMRQAGL